MSLKQEVLQITQSIPYGMVTSYGAVALQVEKIFWKHTSWWMVGRILGSMTIKDFAPWWRVVNKLWHISTLKLGEKWLRQIHHLVSEGVEVHDNTIDMRVYWYEFE